MRGGSVGEVEGARVGDGRTAEVSLDIFMTTDLRATESGFRGLRAASGRQGAALDGDLFENCTVQSGSHQARVAFTREAWLVRLRN